MLNGIAMMGLTRRRLRHIVGLGQSNEQGAQSEPVVSSTYLGPQAVTFQCGIQTRSQNAPAAPEQRDAPGFALKPLTPVGTELWVGEPPAVGMISQLMLVSNHAGDAACEDPRFLYTFPHMGGKHLAELDWRNYETNPANPIPGPGGYQATFIDDIRRARGAAEDADECYDVMAFHLTQGENEGIGYLLPGGSLLDHSSFVPAYKADLALAYAKWDADARAVTGQMQPIPLFISQVDNFWAGQAQAQLANQSADIFLVGPIYYVPSALNSAWNRSLRGHRAHLSADGQRWRGEQSGKVMSRVLFGHEDWRPLQPRTIRRTSDTAIVLSFDVPRPPLAFEIDWLPRAPSYGFEVHLGTQDAPGQRCLIADVAITGPVEVTIALDPQTPLLEGSTASVTYGQALTVGVASMPVGAIRPGPGYANGTESTELIFVGDLRAEFEPLLVEGCFVLRQLVKTGIENDALAQSTCSGPVLSASIVVRDLRFDGVTTIVRGETRSIEGSLVVGDICAIERDRHFGNLRDSDPARSNFVFSDPSYGKRFGQPYPLQNFCVVFTEQVETQPAG